MPIAIPESIVALVPYVPGKPIEETKREFGLKKVVKLASNENPLGPSPLAVKAIRKAERDLHRYPDASAFTLKTKLAKFLNVKFSEVMVGNGSDDLIDLITRTLTVPGDAILTTAQAFSAYKVCAQTNGVETVEVPLDEALVPRLDLLLEALKKEPRIKILFLANPNNPTGTFVRSPDLIAFLKQVRQIRGGSVLVVLDYAYWEYVDSPEITSPDKLYPEFSNVIVLRTFSKIYGLAGIRVGYGVGAPELLSYVERARQPFTNNNLSLVAAEAAIGDRAFVRKSFRLNLKERARWGKFLQSQGVPFFASQTNSLLIDAQAGYGMSGVELYQACLRRGVIFRPVANYGIPHLLRVSVGTADENAFAFEALRAVRKATKK